MKTTQKLLLCVVIAVAMALIVQDLYALVLDGGTETYKFPENITNKKASISLTNKTKALICDFVITVKHPAPFKITRAFVDDPNQAGESWRVDDNNNDQLDGGEGDDLPPAAAEKVRIEEHGENQCAHRGQTVSLELEFDQNPRQNDELTIAPTSKNAGVILVSWAYPAEFWLEEEYLLFPKGYATVINTTPTGIDSFPVGTDPGVSVVTLTSPTHSGWFDSLTNIYTLGIPFYPQDTMVVEFVLSNFNPSGPKTRLLLGPAAIPTLTEWGLIIFGVVLLGFITWVFLRRRRAVAVS